MAHGLPYALSTMLQQLCTNNDLRSWNIFEGKNGQICCNIQFDVCDIIGDSQPVHDPTCSYRRVSKQQQARNLTRVARYRDRTKVDHNNKRDQYTSTDQLSTPQNKKRKCDSNTPEQNRENNDELDIVRLNIDSPETCVVDQPVCHNELESDSCNDTTTPSTHNSNVEYVDMVQDLSTTPYETVQCEASDPETDEKRLPSYHTDTATSFSPPPESPSSPVTKSYDPVLYCPCCEAHMTVTHECNIELDTNTEEPNASHIIGTHSSFPQNSNAPNDSPTNDPPQNPDPEPPDIPRPWADLTTEEQGLRFLELVKLQFQAQGWKM